MAVAAVAMGRAPAVIVVAVVAELEETKELLSTVLVVTV